MSVQASVLKVRDGCVLCSLNDGEIELPLGMFGWSPKFGDDFQVMEDLTLVKLTARAKRAPIDDEIDRLMSRF